MKPTRDASILIFITTILLGLQVASAQSVLNESFKIPETRIWDLDIDGNTIGVCRLKYNWYGKPINEARLYRSDNGQLKNTQSLPLLAAKPQLALSDNRLVMSQGRFGAARVSWVFSSFGPSLLPDVDLSHYAFSPPPKIPLVGNNLYDLDTANGIAVIGNPEDLKFSFKGRQYQLGAAYLYNTRTGALLHELTSPDPIAAPAWGSVASDNFGASTAISESFVAVTRDLAGSNTKSVYIFDVASGKYLHRLTAASGGNPWGFGRSIAISGSTVVVGGSREWDPAYGLHVGTVYVFNAATGTLLRRLTAPSHTSTTNFERNSFGKAVAISGERLLIGAARFDVAFDDLEPDPNVYGSAYLYDTNNWNLKSVLTPTGGPVRYSFYGQRVAIDGDKAIVGADDGLYVFDL